MTVEDYLNLIPSANRQQPDFEGVVTAAVAVKVRVQDLLQSMIALFDVDVAAGEQLDIIGQWVGVTRDVQIPGSGIYFSWDDTVGDGWDSGSWFSGVAPAPVITELPDDAYRTLIRAKIAANRWDGTTDGAYAIWDQIFSAFTILIIDHQDMSYDLAVVGGVPDALTIALLTGGYIPLKPEGVRVNEYLIPVNDGPVFAWDSDSVLLQGWDTGSWMKEIPPT